jgi:hypothetical protein
LTKQKYIITFSLKKLIEKYSLLFVHLTLWIENQPTFCPLYLFLKTSFV